MMLRPIFATSVFERLRGLLGRRGFDMGSDEVLVLCPCNDIHTFGMRIFIDVAFIDSSGRVIASCEHVRPARRLRERKAVMVLERPTLVSSGFSVRGPSHDHGSDFPRASETAAPTPWIKVGQRICFCVEPITESEHRSKV